jgi:hypothetical protein
LKNGRSKVKPSQFKRKGLRRRGIDDVPGCGHDAISASVQRAYFESSIDPRKVVKLSGIGCSSKTPAYFLSQSFGFNAVHGRMSAVATGANLANHMLLPIGVSGDGDTSAIGLGNFCHMMRRNVNITYIIENNGVYGLTKGQFSATADVGSVMKGGKVNDIQRSIWQSWRSRSGQLMWPKLFRRPQTVNPDGSGRVVAQRQRDSGCDQPVRHFQQPRGINQEFKICERPFGSDS